MPAAPRKDDSAASVTDAEAIVAGIERKLGTARRELDDIARARKLAAFEAELGDCDAIDQLARAVSDEAATWDKICNLELALEVGQSKLAAAKEAEIVARRPRYRSERGRAHVAAGEEFTSTDWPRDGDVPLNEAAESVLEYFKTHEGHPRLPASPWVATANCVDLPELPPHKPRPVWRDPRKPWRTADSAAGLDAIVVGPLTPPPAPPRRPAGSQRRV